jgi:diguanylate cyclase (GGDEF)-like protein
MALDLLDLGHFKAVNDRLGHGVGDEVLRELAGPMHQPFRADDRLRRIGGEEFANLLPGLGGRDAVNACERPRLAVARHPWSPARGRRQAPVPGQAGGRNRVET